MIAFDNVSEDETLIGAGSLTYSHTCTGDNLILVVGVAMQGGASVSGVTYNGVALTKIRHDTTGGLSTSRRSELWYLINPATGANNVVVTLSGSSIIKSGAISLTGVDQVTPIEANDVGDTGTTSPVSATITTIADNCWTLDCVSLNSNQPSSFQTERWSIVGATVVGAGSTAGPKTPAGDVTHSYTYTGTDAALSLTSIRPHVAPITRNLLGVGV